MLMLIYNLKLDNAQVEASGDADANASKLLPDADAACRSCRRFPTTTISWQRNQLWESDDTGSEIIFPKTTLSSDCQLPPPGSLPCSCSPYPWWPSSSRRNQFLSSFVLARNEPDINILWEIHIGLKLSTQLTWTNTPWTYKSTKRKRTQILSSFVLAHNEPE